MGNNVRSNFDSHSVRVIPISVVPHERTQSLGISQGPLERRLRLVSFTPHSSGSIEPTLPHLDVDVASHLLVEQADRARSARRAAGPERWMHTGHSGGSSAEPARAEG
ncbi:MAG: PH domain-containing protein, partial [Candidatus Phytoplasma australasiaticum]|nr:PH domain-containing protein [Candidatus Phytoplasma australasiaticum]